jgi:hypothetical protein
VAAPYTRVDPYSLVNLSVRYRFASPLAGWEAQFVAFNLLADDHVQVLPMLGSQIGGQGGEVVRGRRALRLVYRF